jgi:hypothetical protein
VGPELFKQRIKDTAITTLCTASDEAFTLLLLENSYARWVDIYETSGGIPSQRRGDLKRQFASNIEAKYTRGGIKLSPDIKSQLRKGWTSDGIKHFNTLFAWVQKEKIRKPKYDQRVIKDLREKQDGRVNEKKRKHETILAAHSLWEQDPIDEDETEGEEGDVSDEDGGRLI